MLTLRTRSGPVTKLLFTSNGVSLTAATDTAISHFRTLDRSNPQKINVYRYADMEFAEEDRVLLLPEHGGLRRVDVTTGAVERIQLSTSRMARIAVTRDSRRFVVAQPDDAKHPGYLSLRSCSAPAEPQWLQPFPCAWMKRLLIHEGKKELHCIFQNEHPFPTDFWFETFSLSSGAHLRRSDLLAQEYDDDAVISPDGDWLAMFPTSTTRISLYPSSGSFSRPAVVLKNEGRKSFTSIAFHPSGRYLAATSNDATVKLYDTETWQVAQTFTWNIGRLRSVAFSPDGVLAAVGSDTGKIVVWDVDL